MRIEYFHASKYGNGATVAEQMPTEEQMARWQRVIPTMNELLQAKGLAKVAEGKVLVTGLKGPLACILYLLRSICPLPHLN